VCLPTADILPAVGLIPVTPFHDAGILILPPISLPRPNTEAPEPMAAPSPANQNRILRYIMSRWNR